MRTLAATSFLFLLALATAAPAAQNATARRSMDTVLPEMKFTNVTLNDAMDFLRDVSGANLHVNWRALEAAGVTKDTQVNLRLRSVTLRKVLDLLLSEASSNGQALTYYLDGGVIEVTTRELADKQLITKVYPVEDLIMEIPEFDNAPNFNLNSKGNSGNNSNNGNNNGNNGGGNNNGGNNGGGNNNGNGLFSNTNGGSGGTQKETSMSKSERANALIALIVETIQSDIWKDNGGPASIKFWNGSLIITAPRSVHEQIGGPID